MQGMSNPSASRVSWETPGDTSRATRLSRAEIDQLPTPKQTCPAADRNPSYLGWKGRERKRTVSLPGRFPGHVGPWS